MLLSGASADGQKGRGEGGEDEGGFVERALGEELTREGQRAMGLTRYRKEHNNPALEEHHKLLNIAYQW